jgi:hypothetical protein
MTEGHMTSIQSTKENVPTESTILQKSYPINIQIIQSNPKNQTVPSTYKFGANFYDLAEPQ